MCYYELKVVKRSQNKLTDGKKGAYADAGGTTVSKDYKPDADGRKCQGCGFKKKMGVSPETVRRDLENMESQGLIRRTRGGAFLADKEDLSGERTIPISEFFSQGKRESGKQGGDCRVCGPLH